MNKEPFIIERTYNAPADKVWQAITDKDKMKQWYFKLEEFKPEVGFEFHFSGGSKEKTYLHICTITEVIPGKKLTHTWTYGGYPGHSFVTFELFDEGDKTRLKLTHIGIESFPDEPDFARTSFAKGWTHIIGTSLKEYLEGAYAWNFRAFPHKNTCHAELVSAPHGTFTLAWSATCMLQTKRSHTFLMGCRNKFGMTLVFLNAIFMNAPHPCITQFIYYFCMMTQQANNPLHGKTLEAILNALVAHYGWPELAERIRINCFTTDPSIKSSLKFLRKTDWARKKIEDLYVATPYLTNSELN